jgi:hypothetical protein
MGWSPRPPLAGCSRGVHRCLLRVETPRWPEGRTWAATTHPDDRAGLDAGVAFRIASVTKMMTATALWVLADRGHCRLDDPAGRHLPSDVVDRFHDPRSAPTLPPSRSCNSWTTPADCRTSFRSLRSWTRCATALVGGGSRPGPGRPGGGRRAALIAARNGPRLNRLKCPQRSPGRRARTSISHRGREKEPGARQVFRLSCKAVSTSWTVAPAWQARRR